MDLTHALTICYVIAGTLATVLVMMHSGRGTGLAASVRTHVTGAAASVAERNVNHATLVASLATVALALAVCRLT